jgi:sugar O-acyltransferase (sialic acid O-acetyltransferase NeuD family)
MIRAVGIGAGGHARVVLDSVLARGEVEVVGLLDANSTLWGAEMFGVPVLGGDELLEKLAAEGVRHAFVGIGGTRDNKRRAAAFERAHAAGMEVLTVVHPSAVVSPNASLGEGTVVLPGAIVNAGARLGRNVIVNSGAIVEHDCELGDHVHVATGACLAGAVVVGEGSLVGAGASVRQGIRIGPRALIAMGAAVVDDVAEGAAVAGVPATPMAGVEH